MHQHTEAAEPGSEQQTGLANVSTRGKIDCSGPHEPLVEGCSLHSGTEAAGSRYKQSPYLP